MRAPSATRTAESPRHVTCAKLSGMPTIDLNADLGEDVGDDEALLRLVTSANIACGAHAGNPALMRHTLRRCRELGVAAGAHPGLADPEHFGRRPAQGLSPTTVRTLVLAQVGELTALAHAEGTPLHHVKLHGALAHQVAADPALAQAVAEALQSLGALLAWTVMPGTTQESTAVAAGVPLLREAYVDRTYTAKGRLVPRGTPGALLEDPALAARRAVAMVERQALPLADGGWLAVAGIDTLCVHGDTPSAVRMARAVREALARAGITVASPIRR